MLKSIVKTESGFSNLIVIIIIVSALVVITITGAGLTKAGYIPNYLGLELLCSEESSGSQDSIPVFEKPIIYLYPTKIQSIKVELDYKGKIIADNPNYDYSLKGWKVIAYPDGHLINQKDNKEYSYLFWEGLPDKAVNYDFSKGFIVKGEDTKDFLQKKLSEIGLTQKEYNDFIVYWYPRMKDNEYNLIHFAGKEYTDIASLTITPKPDSILRVFMVFKSINNQISIQPQVFNKFERKGFTVIEWGGTELK